MGEVEIKRGVCLRARVIGSSTKDVRNGCIKIWLARQAKLPFRRERPEMKIENVLVPLDGSELSLKALEHAEKLALPLGAKVILLRVGGSIAPEAFGLPELSMALANELTLQQAKHEVTLTSYLEQLAEPLREKGLNVETVVRSGDAATQIVELAESEHVDLVVMSSHGRTGLTRWIYGSVAERVLHNARCSLLVVRIPPEHLS